MSFCLPRPAFLFLFLVLALLGRAAQAGAPAAGATPSLAGALNPDGTLRAGASGSFDARQFSMQTAADGRPVFRPSGATGAGDYRWADGFGLSNGTNGRVEAILRVGVDIYIGGDFSIVGGVVAYDVARWDGTAWHALGSGTGNGGNNVVWALAVAPNGDLYAGGNFNQAGGVAAYQVARWDGTAWHSLGTGPANGVGGFVEALAVTPNGDVYVGGSLTQAGGVPVNNVARWDGTAWYALGTGVANNPNGYVAVAVLTAAPNGDVYMGGRFGAAGGVVANSVARWDGTAWHSLGSGPANGVDVGVSALVVTATGDLYAGGDFGQAGGVAARAVARWDGTTWSALGTGPANGAAGSVSALALAGNGDVYASSFSFTSGNVPVNRVDRWNGAAWTAVGPPGGSNNNANEFVRALAVAANGEVYAGGSFNKLNGVAANRVIRWTGTAWQALRSGAGNGANRSVMAVAVAPNGDVYAGGDFTVIGGVAASHVAKWNGTTWSSLGTGPTNGVGGFLGLGYAQTVYALAVASNGDLYVGGDFTQAGGIAASQVARWNGTAWSALGTGIPDPGVSQVLVLAVGGNNNVYVGGRFTQAGGVAANNVARWDGTTWHTLGTGPTNGVNGGVLALAVAGTGDLYVGGSFTQAGGGVASRVARWDGTAWNPLGAGVNVRNTAGELVYALAVASNGDVYAAGDFEQVGGVLTSGVAKWNGATWRDLGTGPSNGYGLSVYTLAVSASGDVYAGGIFDAVGGVAANHVARWNGTTWNTLGTGLNEAVYQLAVGPNNKLYAGGDFIGVGDNSKASAYFAIYDPAAVSATTPAAPRETLQLTPNPAHGAATLTLPPTATARAGQVLDGLGRVVRAFVVPAQAGTAQLPVGGLPAGAYVVRVGAASGRLVVE